MRLPAALIGLAIAGCSSSPGEVPHPAPAAPAPAAPASASVAPEPDAESPTPVAPAEPEAPVAEPAAPKRAASLELTFVGDVIFGRYRPSGYDPIPEDGHPVFAEMADDLRSDLLVGNLETPVVRDLPDDSPIGSRFRFGASPQMARLLVDAGFGAMTLANNHWFDMRLEGVQQTPAVLEELGVTPLGRAREEPPTFRVESLERKGWRIGFVAITARSNSPTDREGVPRVPFVDTREIAKTIGPLLQAARADHDLLAVLVHWGDEYADAPSLAQVRAAHDLVDAGADMVVGHHPHVLQGVERHGDGVIAYSLGNFLFENTRDPPRLTGVLRVRWDAGDRACLDEVVFHPAYIKRMPVQHPVPAIGHMGRRVRTRMEQLGARLGTHWDEHDDDLVLADVPRCAATGE